MKVIGTLSGLAVLTLTALGGPEPLPESKESKAVVAPERPIYNWTGFYIGINGDVNGVHELLWRSVLHPVTGRTGVQRALCIDSFGLPGNDEDS